MQEVTGINHIGLRVTSLERARAFYEQLGFVFIIGPIGPEPVAVMIHPSGVNINFIVTIQLIFLTSIMDRFFSPSSAENPGNVALAK